MESLNSYISDCESDYSTEDKDNNKPVTELREVDANCEPVTMEMSEDSSEESDSRKEEDVEQKLKKNGRHDSTSSYSSNCSPPTLKKRSDVGHSRSHSKDTDEDRKSGSSDKRISEKRSERKSNKRTSSRDRSRRDSEKDRKYRNEDRAARYWDDRDRRLDKDDRRDRDRNRTREKDRVSSNRSSRSERKHSHRSKSRSRSSSHSHYRKHRSRSRSRSRSPYSRRHYDDRRSYRRRRSPYKSSRRSRSRSPKSPYRGYERKNKLQVLEKLGIEIKVPSTAGPIISAEVLKATGTQLTPQLLLQKTMEEQVEKVKSATGIELPSYYNPIAVNPSKYAEQIQKRRLLWGNKQKSSESPAEPNINVIPVAPTQPTQTTETKPLAPATIWQGATFGGDQDGKMTAKFKRLMGIKGGGQSTLSSPDVVKSDENDLIKKQEEMFNSMESQYEVARLATHSHRGLGLGFGTFQPR